jgi:hypothetical protein
LLHSSLDPERDGPNQLTQVDNLTFLGYHGLEAI